METKDVTIVEVEEDLPIPCPSDEDTEDPPTPPTEIFGLTDFATLVRTWG